MRLKSMDGIAYAQEVGKDDKVMTNDDRLIRPLVGVSEKTSQGIDCSDKPLKPLGRFNQTATMQAEDPRDRDLLTNYHNTAPVEKEPRIASCTIAEPITSQLNRMEESS